MTITIDPAALLRPGLLEGVSVLIAGPPAPADRLALAVGAGCAELGGLICACVPDAVEERALDASVTAVLAGVGSIDMLVVDGAGLFAHGLARDGDAHAALRACLDAAWNVTRAVVNHAFLPGPIPAGSPNRRIVYLAPAPDAGEYAPAARAALENLARTLSVEWARHAINVATIAPGGRESHPPTSPDEVAALTAYLASPAGAYFSGCLLDLGGTR